MKPLIAALKDESGLVQIDALVALGEMGPPAVEPLIEGLKDKNRMSEWEWRRHSGRIKDVRAAEPLIGILRILNQVYVRRRQLHSGKSRMPSGRTIDRHLEG